MLESTTCIDASLVACNSPLYRRREGSQQAACNDISGGGFTVDGGAASVEGTDALAWGSGRAIMHFAAVVGV